MVAENRELTMAGRPPGTDLGLDKRWLVDTGFRPVILPLVLTKL